MCVYCRLFLLVFKYFCNSTIGIGINASIHTIIHWSVFKSHTLNMVDKLSIEITDTCRNTHIAKDRTSFRLLNIG